MIQENHYFSLRRHIYDLLEGLTNHGPQYQCSSEWQWTYNRQERDTLHKFRMKGFE